MANQFSNRSVVVKTIFIVVGVIFIVRLSTIQLFGHKYRDLAERQALRNITQYPARGLIYDRNGDLLVYNEAVYDLMVIPYMTKHNDTAAFCRALGISHEDYDSRIEKARKYSSYTASPFMKQISKEE